MGLLSLLGRAIFRADSCAGCGSLDLTCDIRMNRFRSDGGGERDLRRRGPARHRHADGRPPAGLGSSPLRVSILHSESQVQLDDRLRVLADDLANIAAIRARSPDPADAVEAHAAKVATGINSKSIRTTADRLIAVKSELFGLTNAGSAHMPVEADAKPKVDAEDITGKEGRISTRLHDYKARDRKVAKRVRDDYRHANGGKLRCECCDTVPVDVYGDAGDRSMGARHKVPIEELQPDSITPVTEMAMACATCHRVIHSEKPCLTTGQVRELLSSRTLTVADTIDPARRSRDMARIMGRDTKPELVLRSAVHRMGLFRVCRRDRPDKPDVVFPVPPTGRPSARVLLARACRVRGRQVAEA